jgi:hypothetical protein
MVLGEIFISLDYILIGGVVAVLGWAAFILYWTDIKKWNPEANVFRKCRKKGLPILEVISGGRVGWVPGEKVLKGSLDFKDRTYGLFVDPRILGNVPALVTKGALQVLHFATKFPVPVTPGSSSALVEIRNYARKNHPDLSFLDDLMLLQLIATDRADLEYNTQRVVSRVDTLMDTDAVAAEIIMIQEATSQIQCNDGIIPFEAGIQLNPSVFLSQEVASMINIVRAQVEMMNSKKMDDITKYGMAIFFVLLGAGLLLKIGGFV